MTITNQELWAVLIFAAFALIAVLAWAGWALITEPKGKHFAHNNEPVHELETVWVNEDQLLDAVWRQENLRFDEAVNAYRRLRNHLQLVMSADPKTGAGPLVSGSKIKLAHLVIESFRADEVMLDVECVATWLDGHRGPKALAELVKAADAE